MPSGNSAGILGGCRIYQVWKIKRDNTEFLKYTKKYIDRLYQEVGPLQCTKGGPIIMVQCENEFGSYVS